MTAILLALLSSSNLFTSVLDTPAVSVGRESDNNGMVEVCSGIAVSPSHALTLFAFARDSEVFLVSKDRRIIPDSMVHFRDMGLSMMVFEDTVFTVWEQPRNNFPSIGAALIAIASHPTGFSVVRTFPIEELDDGAVLLASTPSPELMGAPVFDSYNMLAGMVVGSFDPGDGRGELMAMLPSGLWYIWVESLLTDAGLGSPPFGVTAMPATTGLSSVQGILILEVQRGSAADSCGLEEGDIVTGINGERVFHPEALKGMIQSRQDDLLLQVQRDGVSMDLTVPSR